MEKLNFTSHLDEIERDVINTAKFLNEECYVLSHKLLPYVKQFVALTMFFKEVKCPTRPQLDELRRWFFYTTINQSFLNGSLSIVRPLFRRFEDFIHGRKDTAIDYQPIDISRLSFDYRYSNKSALSNFLILAQIHHYLKTSQSGTNLTYLGYYKHCGSKPEGIIPYLTSEDRRIIPHIMKQTVNLFDEIDRFALNNEILWEAHNSNKFIRKRGALLQQIEKELIESVGLKIKDTKQS